ncbi:MAG: hypothetical protein AAGC70_01710 [Pseudomonadota bacterium]
MAEVIEFQPNIVVGVALEFDAAELYHSRTSLMRIVAFVAESGLGNTILRHGAPSIPIRTYACFQILDRLLHQRRLGLITAIISIESIASRNFVITGYRD